MPPHITLPEGALREICDRYRIRSFSLFGSVLREDFGPGSDVDVLIEFQPGARVGLFRLYDLEQELSKLLGGLKVDVNTPASLSPYFKDQVLKEAEVRYVAA